MVDDRGFDPAREQRFRLSREELVERVLARDEHGQPAPAASGSPPLLPQGRDRARESDRDRAVEEADVDAELERVGRGDAEQLALDQPPLDVTSLLGGVARAVRSEPARRGGVHPLDREAVDQLRGLAALREADRPETPRGELRQ